MKSVFKGIPDGIGLYHISHKAKGKNKSNGEKSRQKTSETSFESSLDVVNGTAHKRAVFYHSGVLGHNGFGIDGSHPEKSAYPHPENSARTAGSNGCCGAGDVSGTYLSCDCRRQRLKRAQTVLAAFPVKRKVSKKSFHTCSEFSDLDKTKHKGKKHSFKILLSFRYRKSRPFLNGWK